MKTTFIILSILLILTACVPKDEAKVGLILPMTGKAAYIGEATFNGITLAKEESNSNIKLILEDSKTSVDAAATAANKLIHIDNVDVLVSSLTGPSATVASIAENNKVVLLYSSTSIEPAQNKEYVFDSFPSAIDFCKVATENALKKNITNLAYITDFKGGGADCEIGINNAIKDASKGQIVFNEKFDINNADFRTILTKVKAVNPDGLIIYTYGTLFPEIYTQMINLNLNITLICPFTTSIGYSNQESIDIGKKGDLFQNAIGSDFNFDINNPNVKDFVEKYKTRFNKLPDGFAAYGYSNFQIITQALKTNNIKQTLEEDSFNTLTGTISYNEEGVAILSVKSIEYVNGTWISD